MQLQNAFLETTSSSRETTRSASSRELKSDSTSSMSNFIDSIKLSSSSGNKDEIKRPKPKQGFDQMQRTAPGLSFTAITESLSASSEDISDAIGKSFGMFKTASSSAATATKENQKLHVQSFIETTNSIDHTIAGTSIWASFSGDHIPLSQRTLLKTRSQRTDQILDHIGSSEDSDSGSEGWEDCTATGSKDVSLLDAAQDEGQSDGCDDDYVSDEDSFYSYESSDADGIERLKIRLKLVINHVGACFSLGRQTFGFDDEISMSSAVYDGVPQRGRSRSPRSPLAPSTLQGAQKSSKKMTQGNVKTNNSRSNLFGAMFGCATPGLS